jgi:hypothetical protein
MSYQEKFQEARESLLEKIEELLTRKWNSGWFSTWLSIDAGMDVGHWWQHIFKEHFERYMTEQIENDLFMAGRQLEYALCAFLNYKSQSTEDEIDHYDEATTLEDMLIFSKSFLDAQLDDFDNWCGEISMAMYEESSEYERENGIRPPEDNPS